MKKFPSVLDNRQATLQEYLSCHIPDAELFRLVSAYFSVYGFGLLADELESNQGMKVRFLFGAPESVSDLEAGEQAERTFMLTEEGLVDNGIQVQRPLAEKCAEWVERDQVQVRKVRKVNFLHGKMYHLTSGQRSVATVGSSNFTHRGLGGSEKGSNLEINLSVSGQADLQELAVWFDNLWNDPDLVEDARQEMLDELNRWRKEYSPLFVYYKTLYELFRKELEDRTARDQAVARTHLHDTRIWQALYGFQRDGAQTVIGRLEKHGGCILADSVGLGKTYTALAAIKYFELRNDRVLVLCPKNLIENWRIYQTASADRHNPFIEDAFNFSLLAHTDLTRDRGMSGSIDLAQFNWDNFDLVVIDESHNFRNDSKSRKRDGKIISGGRYEKLLEDIIKSGVRTKVLMLSATPVNTSLVDLRNQFWLITGREDHAFRESLGIRSINNTIRNAQRKFRLWEQMSHKDRNKDRLLEMMGGDFLHLLGELTIARSRRQIQKFYEQFIRDEGDFPETAKPQNEYPPTDSQGELSYEGLYEDLKKLEFHIYRPSYYLKKDARKHLEKEKKEHNFTQQDREIHLVAMMRINFLKRLESSVHSFRVTLDRVCEKINRQIEQIDKYIQNHKDEMIRETPVSDYGAGEYQPLFDPDEDDESIVSQDTVQPYKLSQLEVVAWRKSIESDLTALQEALVKVKKISPDRDGKLLHLKNLVQKKAGQANRKLLVFTAYRDTAEYLYENLQDIDISMAMVAGGGYAQTQSGRIAFIDVLHNFSPQARKRVGTENEIDLLIATDCISEGQNLQDCDTVLNYDIHWNPVRLIQRFGRINRIGSRNKSVKMINYWPIEDINKYLNLEDRVRARMALVDVTATGSDDPLSEAEAEATDDMNFRDKQLKLMLEEPVNMDIGGDAVTLSDLTLDYFLSQLLRYLETHKEELDKAPPGIYAVLDGTNSEGDQVTNQSGAIFVFRQLREGTNASNPTHPLYLIHMSADGRVRHGYTNVHAILEEFDTLTDGKKDPLKDVCDAFSRELDDDLGKQRYNRMAREAIKNINTRFEKTSVEEIRQGYGRDAILPRDDEKPTPENLQLVTWAIIKSQDSFDTPGQVPYPKPHQPDLQ